MALTTVKNSGLSGSIDLTSKVTGSLPVANGGTGLAAGTTDQYLKFTGTTTLASAAVASDYVLIQSQSTTSAASLSFTTSFDGTYDTHVFVVNNLEGASKILKPLIDKRPIFLTWLPLSHSYEHTVQFAQIAVGAKVFYAEKIEKLIAGEFDRAHR